MTRDDRAGKAKRTSRVGGVRTAVAIAIASLLLLFRADAVDAVSAAVDALDPVLDNLVKETLIANLEVAGAEATVAQRVAALDVAKAHYLPTLDLDMRYARATGGREFDVPLDDYVNPVYSTLNDLLAAQGKPPAFELVDNFSIPFIREESQQTLLHLSQPLYDPRIPAARRGADSDRIAALGGLEALRGRLARDVKQAYYRWLGVGDAVVILDATLDLARANLAVNESLLRNGKITRDLVYRAEADVLEVEQQRLSVANALVLTRASVNLIRNQPLERELPSVTVADDDIARRLGNVAAVTGSPTLQLGLLQDTATGRRAELRQLDAVIAAADAAHDVARAANHPQVALEVDAGSDATTFSYGGDDLFAIASLVVRFNLFRGGADAATIREAVEQRAGLHAARALTEQRIRLEVLDVLQSFRLAEASLRTAEKRVVAADGAFGIAQKKRDLGQINQTEFIDARRVLTDAKLSLNRARFEALAALAALEYATGVPPYASTEEEKS